MMPIVHSNVFVSSKVLHLINTEVLHFKFSTVNIQLKNMVCVKYVKIMSFDIIEGLPL